MLGIITYHTVNHPPMGNIPASPLCPVLTFLAGNTNNPSKLFLNWDRLCIKV